MILQGTVIARLLSAPKVPSQMPYRTLSHSWHSTVDGGTCILTSLEITRLLQTMGYEWMSTCNSATFEDTSNCSVLRWPLSPFRNILNPTISVSRRNLFFAPNSDIFQRTFFPFILLPIQCAFVENFLWKWYFFSIAFWEKSLSMEYFQWRLHWVRNFATSTMILTELCKHLWHF